MKRASNFFTEYLNGYYSNAPAGVRISFLKNSGTHSSCTAGFMGYYQHFTPVMVTATHCSKDFGELDSGNYYQPDSARTIGSEMVDDDWWSCSSGDRTYHCVYADANIVGFSGHTPDIHSIARPDGTGTLVVNFNKPRFDVVGGVASSTVGMEIWMVGQTSGMSEGEVDSTCRHFNLSGDELVLCMDVAHHFNTDAGDSGAPVFQVVDWDDSEVLMVGVHKGKIPGFGLWPTKYLFSPMSQIYLAYPQLEILPE